MLRWQLPTIALCALMAQACSGGGSKNVTGGSGGSEETGGSTGGSKTGGSGGSATGGSSGSTGGSGGSTGGGGGWGTGGMVTADASAPADSGSGTSGDAGTGASKMSFFITSRTGNGVLGGLEGADMICKTLATAVGAGNKTWKAYLSNQNPMVHAKDRIGMGPWFNVKGAMVATSLANLHDGAQMMNNLTAATVLTEKGEAVPGRMRPAGAANEHDILTGTQMDGTLVTGQTCGDWKMEGATARVGHFDRGGGGGAVPMSDATSWNSSHNNSGCGLDSIKQGGGAGRFYCFASD